MVVHFKYAGALLLVLCNAGLTLFCCFVSHGFPVTNNETLENCRTALWMVLPKCMWLKLFCTRARYVTCDTCDTDYRSFHSQVAASDVQAHLYNNCPLIRLLFDRSLSGRPCSFGCWLGRAGISGQRQGVLMAGSGFNVHDPRIYWTKGGFYSSTTMETITCLEANTLHPHTGTQGQRRCTRQGHGCCPGQAQEPVERITVRTICSVLDDESSREIWKKRRREKDVEATGEMVFRRGKP